MTEYREQAIKDMRSCYNLKDFAVAQREQVLRLEAVLRKIDILAESSELCGDHTPAVTSRTLRPLIGAALEAVKEG